MASEVTSETAGGTGAAGADRTEPRMTPDEIRDVMCELLTSVPWARVGGVAIRQLLARVGELEGERDGLLLRIGMLERAIDRIKVGEGTVAGGNLHE